MKLAINKKKVSEAELTQIFRTMAPHKKMVSACVMDQDFAVTDDEGNKTEGSAGDYLIRHNDESLSVVSKEDFEANYSFGRS